MSIIDFGRPDSVQTRRNNISYVQYKVFICKEKHSNRIQVSCASKELCMH